MGQRGTESNLLSTAKCRHICACAPTYTLPTQIADSSVHMSDCILKCVRFQKRHSNLTKTENKQEHRKCFLNSCRCNLDKFMSSPFRFPRLWRRETLLYKFVRNLPQAIGIATAISPKTKNGNGPNPPWAILSQAEGGQVRMGQHR
jgi:hypothetical protein